MYEKKYIWNTGNSIKDYLQKFEMLAKEIKNDSFLIKKNENNKLQIIELKTKKVISLNEKSFSNLFMQKMLAVWITLGLIKIINPAKDKIYDKKELLDLQYTIQTKESGILLRKYILKHFGKLTYATRSRFLDFKTFFLSWPVIPNKISMEVYKNEYKTVYSILVGALLEKELIEGEINFWEKDPRIILKNCWTGTEIPFDNHLLDIAKALQFHSLNSNRDSYREITKIDKIKKEDYQFNYEIKKDLNINKKYDEYYDSKKNVTIRSYSLFSILNLLEEQNIELYAYEPNWNMLRGSFTKSAWNFESEIEDNIKYTESDHTFGDILVNHNIIDNENKNSNIENIKLIEESQQFINLLVVWRILYLYSYMYQERLEIDKTTHEYFKFDGRANKVMKILNPSSYGDLEYSEWYSKPINFFYNILAGDNNQFCKFIYHKKTKAKDIQRYRHFKYMFNSYRNHHISGRLTQEKFDNMIKSILNQTVLIEFFSPKEDGKKNK